MNIRKYFSLLVFILLNVSLICIAQTDLDKPEVHFNPWELIIYRSENFGELNDIRCWVRLMDENGNDVTYTNASATYEWVSIPGKVNLYTKKYYLSGGMAMHLNIKPGKYKISVFSPLTETEGYGFNKEFVSNEFYYNTENPLKVIFVYPTSDDNGFYNGQWYIDYKAPNFYKYTKPKRM